MLEKLVEVRGSYLDIFNKLGAEEVKYIQGLSGKSIRKILLTPEKSPAANYAFDVTPASLVTGLITERGICRADKRSILKLYPEHKKDLDGD